MGGWTSYGDLSRLCPKKAIVMVAHRIPVARGAVTALLLASVPLATIICKLWFLPIHQTLSNSKVRVSTSLSMMCW